MQQAHELKTLARYFEAVERGDKTFEVRLNDRAFQTGDTITLVKMDNEGNFYVSPPGDRFGKITLKRKITYILQGGQFGIEPRYCVLGLGPVENTDDR